MIHYLGIIWEKRITDIINKQVLYWISFYAYMNKYVDFRKGCCDLNVQLELNYGDFLPHFLIQKFRKSQKPFYKYCFEQ